AKAPPIDGAEVLDDTIASALLPERDKRGHKGAFGKVLVIAGSLDYAGAALLVCRAAGRAGAGLVTLAVPESLQPLFAAKVVEATTMGLPEDDVEEVDPEPALARILDHEHDAVVIGPGLRPGLATAELVRLLISSGDDTAAPIVLDAEALRSLATIEAGWDADHRPPVVAPDGAERLGVYLHGLAGDAVRERVGDAGLLASDLPDAIAMARKRLAAVAERRAAGGKLGFTARLPGADG